MNSRKKKIALVYAIKQYLLTNDKKKILQAPNFVKSLKHSSNNLAIVYMIIHDV